MELRFQQAVEEDFEELVELRIEAMRESLAAIGRFDRERSIERFRGSFLPEETRKVLWGERLVGFVAVKRCEDHLYLDHLYVHPDFQSAGVGSRVLATVIELSERDGLPIRLGALRASRSNAFYARHGFLTTREDEWDIYYERKPKAVT